MNRVYRKATKPINLESALRQCQASAHHGYKIALENMKETSCAINKVSESISNCLKNYDEGSVNTPRIHEQLKKQLLTVVSELEQLQRTVQKDLKDRKKRLDTFSITVFGRTGAGKSTLMEILTHGDGKSISPGIQRKTRDVRSYNWNGLEVTDVPGVAAFEGEKDEELAFHSAAQADLVLFLITDDAPQPVEAECLAQIRRLGKPILGICNIKKTIDDLDDLHLFLHNPNRHFEQSKLYPIFEQFYAFADRLIPGKHIHFLSTHLRARFLAEQSKYINYKTKLIEASRFTLVEQQIIKQVSGRGNFLRIKSFIDGATTPIMELTNVLLEFSAQNSAAGRVLIEKRRQLKDWAEEYKSNGIAQINTLVSKAMDNLRQDISDFSEEYYDDNQVGKKWEKHVKTLRINQKCEKLLNEMSKDCKKTLREIGRELKSELSFIADFSADKSIKMDSIIDSKRWWNWGYIGSSGGLTIAAIVLGSNPLGWAAAAVGIVGWLISFAFEDREQKARKARKKLSKKLTANVNKMEYDLRKKLKDWFYKELIEKQVYTLATDIWLITSAMFELADAQRILAWMLNDRIKRLNKILAEEGLKHINASVKEGHILDIARVPGCAIMFIIAPETKFPDQIKMDLEQLIGESIWFVIDTGNKKSILSQAIGHGCDRNKISIEAKLKVAHVPLDAFDPLTLTRVKLAQQLTGFHITK